MLLILAFKNAAKSDPFNPEDLKFYVDQNILEMADIFQELGGPKIIFIGPDPHLHYEVTPEGAHIFAEGLKKGFSVLNASMETTAERPVTLKYHVTTDESVENQITCTVHVSGKAEMTVN